MPNPFFVLVLELDDQGTTYRAYPSDDKLFGTSYQKESMTANFFLEALGGPYMKMWLYGELRNMWYSGYSRIHE